MAATAIQGYAAATTASQGYIAFTKARGTHERTSASMRMHVFKRGGVDRHFIHSSAPLDGHQGHHT